ncbi:MAG: hypothetical protein CL927_00815, partial [Deltaproteobacteria bacterium]|nr:hypothetical protein [Deltaproteobacteria bacterium]
MVRILAIVHTLNNLAENEAEPADRALQWTAFRWRVAPVAIGQAVAESIRTVYRIPPQAVIPNGIDVARFAPQPDRLHAAFRALDIPLDATIFTTVGRPNEQKNHALLLASRADLPASAHLLVVGDGSLRTSLKAMADDSRVDVLGVRPDVPALLAAAHVFVRASDWEGNPLVVMEAL